MSENIVNKIEDWINSQGYPFEIYVAKAFKEAGFSVGQSVYYNDEITNTPREIDVVAYVSKQIGQTYFSFAFVVECKSSKSKPWIAFKSDSPISNKFDITFLDATIKGKKLLNQLASNDAIYDNELFKFNSDNVCYILSQAFTNGNEVPFNAITSLTKSIASIIKKVDNVETVFSEYKNAFVYFPIIAVDGLLYSFEMDEENSNKIDSIDSIKFISRRQDNNQSFFTVDVITRHKIAHYSKDMYKSVLSLFESFNEEIENVANTTISKYSF